jgi:hypothetical protein
MTTITLDPGPRIASAQSVKNPLPPTWTHRDREMPSYMPTWANFGNKTTSLETRNLLAQIAYDHSGWNYKKIGPNNELGGFQFTTTVLEKYGVLVAGSTKTYGNNAVNYKTCWQPLTQIQQQINPQSPYYAPWLQYADSLSDFLSHNVSQCHLAYKYVFDLYNGLTKIGAIKTTDTDDVIMGMIYVAWNLGVGTPPTTTQTQGTGAYAWRFYNVGSGVQPYNAGRYSVTVLSS